MGLVVGRLKGKEAQDLGGQLRDLSGPGPAPGPHLGRDIEDHWNAQGPCLAGKRQVEVRGVHHHQEVCALGQGGSHGCPEGENGTEACQDLHDAHDRNFFGMGHGLHPGSPHGGTGKPPDLQVRNPLAKA